MCGFFCCIFTPVKKLILVLLWLNAYGQSYELCENELLIELYGFGGLNYFWQLPNGYTETSNDATITINTAGNYPIELTVFNEFGCSQTVKAIVEVFNCSEFTYYAPNAFTPRGGNPTWKPIGTNITFESIMIFTREGQVIFNDTSAWDGTYNRRLVQIGIYPYKVSYRSNDGRLWSDIGRVTVLD